jgi:hypothetical protein
MQTKKPADLLESAIQGRRESPLVSLGTVTRQNPNVSSLLISHPVYKEECWRILFNPVNSNKPFTRIPPGTEIYLDPETREILWGRMLQTREPSRGLAESAQAQPTTEQKAPDSSASLSERLVDAVEPLYGKPYREIDCYELLVKGLTNLGVRYQGAGGLGRRLMVMAKERGLPMNAFFNGEGLIAASGSRVYSKTLLQVRSPERQANELLEEIEPYLQKGQILSFSIHSRGHTGIVSRAGNTWTLINSGRMDNAVTSTGLAKGVGEESLKAEIRDWFELAKNRRESLRITLGTLNEQKLTTFYDRPPSRTKKV